MSESGSPGQSIEELLHQGSKALLFFEAFAPLFARAFPLLKTVEGYDYLHGRFYEQNGMNEQALVDAFEAVSAAAGAMAEHHGQQQTIGQSLSQVWSGSAAGEALSMMQTQLQLASTDADAAKAIAAKLELAPAALRTAVGIKAGLRDTILDNGEVKFDGKTPDDVEAIIAGAAGIGLSNTWGPDTLVNKIRRIFPDMEEGVVDGLTTSITNTVFSGLVFSGSPYANMVEERCQDWLDNVFRTRYPERVETFLQACTDTHQGVLAVYDDILGAMAGLGEDPYPRPQGTSETENPGNGETPGNSPADTGTPSTPSTETPTTPASTPTSTPTDTDDDNSTNPAGTSNPLSGLTNLTQIASQLSPLLTSLTENVQSALTSLSTTIDAEIDKALENLKNLTGAEADPAEGDPAEGEGADTDGDGVPDEEAKPLAEFDLAGKEVTFEQDENGLKMVLTDPDGKTTEYRMTIDENGVPLVSAVETAPGEGEETSEEGTPAAEEQPSGSSSVPSAPSPGKREEDGEYTPEPIPAPEFTEDEAEVPAEPEQPAPAAPVAEEPPVGDTGALLAEAGPL